MAIIISFILGVIFLTITSFRLGVQFSGNGVYNSLAPYVADYTICKELERRYPYLRLREKVKMKKRVRLGLDMVRNLDYRFDTEINIERSLKNIEAILEQYIKERDV